MHLEFALRVFSSLTSENCIISFTLNCKLIFAIPSFGLVVPSLQVISDRYGLRFFGTQKNRSWHVSDTQLECVGVSRLMHCSSSSQESEL